MASIRARLGSRVEAVRATRDQHKPRRIHLVPGAEVVTFLPLQVLLYFNVFYSPLWVVGSIVALEVKYDELATHYKFVTIMVYVVMFLTEPARLYLGYEGNLREKVPELAGFWLLTLLQTPLAVYLLANVDTIILPLEWAVGIPFIVFLVAELCMGFRGLQLMVQAQAIKFHLSQFDSIVPDNLGREEIEMQDFKSSEN